MSDLSDFKRLVYEPEVQSLRARNRELQEQLEAANEEILFLCSDEDDIRKGLREQLETSQRALRDLVKETEPQDHKWAVQGGTRPGDCVWCRAYVALSNPASEPEARNLDGTNTWTPHDDPRGIGR